MSTKKIKGRTRSSRTRTRTRSSRIRTRTSSRIRRIKKGGCINLNRSWNNFKHIFINDINAGTKRVSKLTFSKSKSV